MIKVTTSRHLKVQQRFTRHHGFSAGIDTPDWPFGNGVSGSKSRPRVPLNRPEKRL